MDLSDPDIIELFRQGDMKAFESLYRTYYPRVQRLVRQFVPTPEDARDLTADIFVHLWNKHGSIGSIRNLEAFLFTVTRNSCIDYLRSRKRQDEKKDQLLQHLAQQPEEPTKSGDLRAELLQSIYGEIDKLPPQCRKVFTLSYLEGLPDPDIAERLGINIQSVYNLKHRALKLLRMAVLGRNILITILSILLLSRFH